MLRPAGQIVISVTRMNPEKPKTNRLKRLRRRTESLVVPPLARVYRPLVRRTRIVAVTGSCGKTSTKELIADVLSTTAPTVRSFDSNNKFLSAARTLLELRPRHRNCVFELGASGPGSLAPVVKLLRPHVAVVTAIGMDHYKSFRGSRARRRVLVVGRADHLERLSQHRRGAVRCWRQSCGREIFCQHCELREIPAPVDTADGASGAHRG